MNALKAMIPDLDLDRTVKGVLPHSSKDLGNRYILLCAYKADALQKSLPSVMREGHISVRCWAKLRLPTG